MVYDKLKELGPMTEEEKGTNGEESRFGQYQVVYRAIRDKAPNALVLFQKAVSGMDWTYRMSDDHHQYANGIWQDKTLTLLATLLGQEAEQWFAGEKRRRMVL
jgi:hypothetical protein